MNDTASTSALALLVFLTTASAAAAATPAEGSASTAPPGASGEASPAASGLERLRRLAGDWVQLGEDGKPTSKVVASYRVTAGGSAVVETVFPGSEHEMVTVYHEDGPHLVLTHYCHLGNQPRMRGRAGDRPNSLAFECTGVGNASSESDAHMHDAVLVFVDDDHVQSEWHLHEDGKRTFTAAFDLARLRS